LLAGKGHEEYIVVGKEKINYNEREFIKSIYERYQQKNEIVGAIL
jgi:UDP-N-acetylmuramyl tripeptide synthase